MLSVALMTQTITSPETILALGLAEHYNQSMIEQFMCCNGDIIAKIELKYRYHNSYF